MPQRIAPDAEPIPGYRLIERLGRGGFGEVWKAEAPGGMMKAIKFVYGNLDDATENGKPAEQELKALNRVKTIRHPYILTLERYDIIDGQLVIVMELADRNLYDRFRESREQGNEGIPREELMRYMEETAEALDLMNSQFQLQHLDIKPQNIFLIFNHIKVADFGLAKDLEGMQATLTGGVTPVYAAPETFECKVTRFCDQYSLAIVFQELLTGQRPFNGTTARQLMMQHISAKPDLSSLPPADQPVVGRALSKKPDDRFPTCAHFVQALRAAERPALSIVAPDRTPMPAMATPLTRVGGASPMKQFAEVGGLSGRRPMVSELPSLSGRKGLPPLVGRIAATNGQHIAARTAPPERTGDGVLMPAVIVGLGQYGLLMLQRLRRALRDRFGSASLPHIRMIYVDTDAETLQSVAPSSIGFDPDEIFLAKVNRPAHYSKSREDLPDVSSWINPQLLYRIPRQPATTGIRAFGRLAFCDHHRALMAKLRGDLEACVADSSLDASESSTKLKLRGNRPRVYVISSLMGGTGGGMFLDFAYAAKQQLKQLGYPAHVHGLLLAPQVDKETPKSQAVANSYAALTELYHYGAADTVFEATFDQREGGIADRERPFARCLVLGLPKSGEAATLRPVLGVGVNSLIQDLFAPLGREADKLRGDWPRNGEPATFVQTAGSFRLTWPRRALLERASRRACDRVFADWTTRESAHLTEPVRTWLDAQWAARSLSPELLMTRLRQLLVEVASGDPAEQADTFVAVLDDRSPQNEIDVDEFCAVVERLTQFVGKPEGSPGANLHGRIAQLLEKPCRAASSDAEQQLTAMAASLIEAPAWRLAGAAELIRQIEERIGLALEQIEPLVESLRLATMDLYVKALSQAKSLETMSRGSRRAAIVREIAGMLRQFARKRLEYLLHRAVMDVYRAMGKFGPEYQREVKQARQRIEELRELFTRSSSGGGPGLGPERALLPPGCPTVDEAADRLASSLAPADLAAVEAAIHAGLKRRYPGLMAFCQERPEAMRAGYELILTAVRPLIEPRLGPSNAAAAFFATFRDDHSARGEVEYAFDEALPELTGSRVPPERQFSLIAVPDDAHGERFAELVRDTLPDRTPTLVGGSDDLLVIREHQHVEPRDLPQLGSLGRAAFVHITHSDQAAPHTRHDVAWRLVGE